MLKYRCIFSCQRKCITLLDNPDFSDCRSRKYWDEIEKVWVDRDISAAINLKRVGLELFPTINRRSGKIVKTQTNSTTKEVLAVLKGIPEAYTVPSGQCR